MIKELIAGYKLDIVSHRTHSYGDTDDDVIRGEAKADKLEEVIQDLERIQDLMDWGNDERQESKEIRVIQMDSEGGKFVREFAYSQGQADWGTVAKPEEALDLNTTQLNADFIARCMTTRGGKVKTFTVTVTEKV